LVVDNKPNSIPDLPCLCASYRRAARALTQLYDDAVRPLGLRATQFTILQALSLTGRVSQAQLGAILGLDSTTLTRTLGIMRRRGWIEKRRGRDGRERLFSLAQAGQQQLEQALPAWQGVQDRLSSSLAEEQWKKLFEQNREMTLLAQAKHSDTRPESRNRS
jgi:DNA-binding MarR family transcriptional regulator